MQSCSNCPPQPCTKPRLGVCFQFTPVHALSVIHPSAKVRKDRSHKWEFAAVIDVQAQPWLPDLLKAVNNQLYATSLLVYAGQPLCICITFHCHHAMQCRLLACALRSCRHMLSCMAMCSAYVTCHMSMPDSICVQLPEVCF